MDLSCSSKRALAINGIPSPAEKHNSMKIPFRLSLLEAASIRAEPKKVPMHGVQPIENITPNSAEEKNPVFTVLSFKWWSLLIKGIRIISMKLSPNKIMIIPDTIFTKERYSFKKPPTVPAKAPRVVNTMVKPDTNPMELINAVFFLFSLFCPAKKEM